MDTDDTQTWNTGGYKKYCNNYFFDKKSTAHSSDDSPRFGDAPAPVKSRAALILTEVANQLEVDETEYNSVRDTFDYIKMLYLGAESISSQIVDTIPADKSSVTESSFPLNYLLNDEKKGFDDHVATGETQYYDFYRKTKETLDRKEDEAEPTERSLQYSSRSYKISSRQNIYFGVQDENSSDSGPQNDFSEETNGEGKAFIREEPLENVVADVDDVQIRREHEFSDISTSRQHPYQLHLAEYSKSIHEELEEESREANPSPPEQDQEICFNDLLKSARQQEGKKEDLFLNLSRSVESLQTMKNKKSRSGKRRKVSVSVTSTNKKNAAKQVDDTLYGTSKVRRKKRRDKDSNSRSTTATRDTCLPTDNKKDTRKQKQRGHATMPASQASQHRPETATKIQQNWSEVVEIYHNKALKSGSLSVVSSKHSRLEPRGRNAVHRLPESSDHSKRSLNETDVRRSLKSQKNSQRIDCEEIRTPSKNCHQALQDATDIRSGDPKRSKVINKAECSMIQSNNGIPEECNDYQPHHRNSESHERSSTYYDPLAIRNYELPTVASKMKRVNRSYFNRFNFRNIPFVVGTSVTPSYNLGLNIQETLSLIKTRQMMPGSVTPLLISKVSKGVRPVSTLLGCIGDRDEIPVQESGIRFDVTSTGMCNIYPEQLTTIDRNITAAMQMGPFSWQTPRLTCIPSTQPFFEAPQSFVKTIEVPSVKKRKTHSICSSMKLNLRKNADCHLQLTQSALLRQRQEELNIRDSQSTKWQTAPQNMNGIREVLVNFHDQFESMNLKYEKLQEQAEKSNDESLKKELVTLEKELSAKEEEINAVVSLYKEVMALKQQMKMLYERNSLVCVATESPGSPMYPQISSRAHTANPIFNLYRRNGSDNNRGPSTATRLAGLLRQIKIFQKQLKSAS